MGIRVGRYETICPIASGGMATVHLARAVGVGGFERLVAIKMMHEHIAEEPEFVAMFLDEARLAARIRHPNVVATVDVQQTDDGLFLVMDLVEGPSLRRALRHLKEQGQRAPLDITIRIFIDVLAGLHAAHELKGADGALLNLVHRDVSPANVLVGTDGVVRLTDFGVARAEARLSSTRGGQLKGKIPYMPPEQIMGEGLDRRADIYAAGVVFWESLIGRRLFRANNDGELVHRIISGDVEPPSQLREDIPEAVERVCLKALAKLPDDRYGTAADFADALEDAAAEAGIRLSSSRAVGAFVAKLGVHMTTDELLAKAGAGVPASEGAPVAAPSGSGMRPTEDYSVVSVSSQGALTPSGPGSARSLTDGSGPQSTTQGTSAAGTSTISMARTMKAVHPSHRRPLLVAIGMVMLVALLSASFVWSQLGGRSETDGDAAAEGSPAGHGGEADTASAEVGATTAEPEPAEPEPSAEPDPAATASAVASPPVAVAKPPTAPRPVPSPPRRPPPKPKPSKPASAAGYRPPGL